MPQITGVCNNYLYGNVRIRRIEPDLAAGALMVRAVYAESQEQKIYYYNVLYSQLDKTVEGNRIALTVEITPEEYRGAKHQISALRFQKDCGLQNLNSLEEMARRGYRLFMHYAGERDEYIVIAKSLSGY